MEKPSSASRVSKQQQQKKKKPMKVVYISNPVKFKTSASEFRALVQEHTGQDSKFPIDPNNKFLDVAADCNHFPATATSDCFEPTQIPTQEKDHQLQLVSDDDDAAFENGFLFLESFAELLPVTDNNNHNNSFFCDSTNHVVADPLIAATLDAM